MKTFLIGVGLAVVLAVVTGFALSYVQVGSDVFNSTENVRF